MCERCVEALQRHFPELSEEAGCDLLWEQTCFPFGSCEQIESQIAEVAEQRRSVTAT